jgi:pyruvate kinase
MMDRIIAQTEADPQYREAIDASHSAAGRRQHRRCRRLGGAIGAVACWMSAAMVAYTSSGLIGAAHGARAAASRPSSA